MSNNETKAVYQVVNEASLPEQMAKMLAAYREAQKKANAAREAFNSAFIAAAKKAGKVPAGLDLIVIHKWGKVSVTLAKPGEKQAKSNTAGFSF